MATWNDARREGQRLERQLEDAVQGFRRLTAADSVDEEEGAAQRAEGALHALGGTIDTMVGFPSAVRPATSRAQIQRLREILFEQKNKFREAQRRLKRLREAEDLRLLVQRDMRQDGSEADQELLMRERNSIMNSSRMAGDIINQAAEVHGELVAQRTTFTGATGRLVDIGRQVPGVNSLIQRIENKRTRDNTILALVTAFCTCFMLWYWLSGWGI